MFPCVCLRDSSCHVVFKSSVSHLRLSQSLVNGIHLRRWSKKNPFSGVFILHFYPKDVSYSHWRRWPAHREHWRVKVSLKDSGTQGRRSSSRSELTPASFLYEWRQQAPAAGDSPSATMWPLCWKWTNMNIARQSGEQGRQRTLPSPSAGMSLRKSWDGLSSLPLSLPSVMLIKHLFWRERC